MCKPARSISPGEVPDCPKASCYTLWLGLARDFTDAFSRLSFKDPFLGRWQISNSFRTLVIQTYTLAAEFGLQADALDGFGTSGSLRDNVRRLFYNENSP